MAKGNKLTETKITANMEATEVEKSNPIKQTSPPLYNEPVFVNKQLPKNQYCVGKYEKKQIFLHHTAGGTATSAWNWWNQNADRVGVAFIIDRDGSIWKCFEPEEWGYHLGLKTSSNDALNKSSIGIEIAAWGPLKEKDGKCYAYPGDYQKIVVPESDVVRLKEPFRGSSLYQKYSDVQIKSVCELIVYLKKKFPNIPLPTQLGKFYEYSDKVVKEMTPGLYSHTTVRLDKSDIIPQPSFLEAIQNCLNFLNNK